MKVIIAQNIKFEGDNFPYMWKKEVETNVIPHKGDFIEDSLFKDPGEYEVIETTLNYQENYCYVQLKPYKDIIPVIRRDDFKRIAELHDWQAGWNNY